MRDRFGLIKFSDNEVIVILRRHARRARLPNGDIIAPLEHGWTDGVVKVVYVVGPNKLQDGERYAAGVAPEYRTVRVNELSQDEYQIPTGLGRERHVIVEYWATEPLPDEPELTVEQKYDRWLSEIGLTFEEWQAETQRRRRR